ncbi:MAG: hypothetical protein H7257_02260 [Taibaiella sp.]|nr:hypothetical protein [Taibaiella sp.]
MAKIDLYHTYLQMEKEDIILSFKGDITKDLLSSVYQIIEARMEVEHEDHKRKKKFYHVLVECLQNMYHHMESLQEHKGNLSPEQAGSAIFMIGKGAAGSYLIITGNFILTENADALRNKIDVINGMNAVELKSYYLEKLGSAELSDKGGAGLGIIDIARKSGNKIEYDFQNLLDNFSFFTLTATIN